MTSPAIIQIIGTPGTGKTLVARLAKQQFERMNLKVAILDIDEFAKTLAAAIRPEEVDFNTIFERLTKGAVLIKNEALRIMRASEMIALDPQTKQGVKTWIDQQQADIVLLELHWPSAILHYPHHEVWLVTAPPEKALRLLLFLRKKADETIIDQIKEAFVLRQRYWASGYSALPRDKYHISNAAYGRNALRYRLDKRTRIIAQCYADGRYEDEDDRTTFPPPQ